MNRLTVSLPGTTEKPASSAGRWVFAVLAVIASFAGGYGLHRQIEISEDIAVHSAILRPLLAYDREHDEKRSRSMNDEMRLVSFFVYHASLEGLNLETVLDRAMPTSQVPPNLKRLMIKRLLENFEQGERYGLFTPDNLAKLSQGKSPVITKGEYQGQRADVEHIVPRSVVPFMDNLLVNLEWLPQSLNASKSDTITPRALNHAERYFEAGLLDFETLEKVRSMAGVR